MGGNALKLVQGTRRYQAAEYHELKSEVFSGISHLRGVYAASIIPACRSKESFGDMDILLAIHPAALATIKDDLCKVFRTTHIYTDGKLTNLHGKPGPASIDKVYSLAFKGLQLDFILATEETYRCGVHYFSWNDLGNLLGRVTHKFGLKLGHEGLLYPFKDRDYLFDELVVERDWEKILPAFGWSFERFIQGFNTLEEIFEFVASSEFFNPDIYLLENRNAKARYRDSKRKTYSAFLDWCERNKDTLTRYEYPEDKKGSLPLMFERLSRSGFKEKYEATDKLYREHLTFKNKFNGEIVKALTGREGEDLGGLISYFRAFFIDRDEFRSWVLNSTEEEIQKKIMTCDMMFG
jgi:hypothetical protein